MNRYRKLVTAAIGAVMASIPLMWDLSVTESEAVTLLTVWATAFGVWGVKNERSIAVKADGVPMTLTRGPGGRFASKASERGAGALELLVAVVIIVVLFRVLHLI